MDEIKEQENVKPGKSVLKQREREGDDELPENIKKLKVQSVQKPVEKREETSKEEMYDSFSEKKLKNQKRKNVEETTPVLVKVKKVASKSEEKLKENDIEVLDKNKKTKRKLETVVDDTKERIDSKEKNDAMLKRASEKIRTDKYIKAVQKLADTHHKGKEVGLSDATRSAESQIHKGRVNIVKKNQQVVSRSEELNSMGDEEIEDAVHKLVERKEVKTPEAKKKLCLFNEVATDGKNKKLKTSPVITRLQDLSQERKQLGSSPSVGGNEERVMTSPWEKDASDSDVSPIRNRRSRMTSEVTPTAGKESPHRQRTRSACSEVTRPHPDALETDQLVAPNDMASGTPIKNATDPVSSPVTRRSSRLLASEISEKSKTQRRSLPSGALSDAAVTSKSLATRVLTRNLSKGSVLEDHHEVEACLPEDVDEELEVLSTSGVDDTEDLSYGLPSSFTLNKEEGSENLETQITTPKSFTRLRSLSQRRSGGKGSKKDDRVNDLKFDSPHLSSPKVKAQLVSEAVLNKEVLISPEVSDEECELVSPGGDEANLPKDSFTLSGGPDTVTPVSRRNKRRSGGGIRSPQKMIPEEQDETTTHIASVPGSPAKTPAATPSPRRNSGKGHATGSSSQAAPDIDAESDTSVVKESSEVASNENAETSKEDSAPVYRTRRSMTLKKQDLKQELLSAPFSPRRSSRRKSVASNSSESTGSIEVMPLRSRRSSTASSSEDKHPQIPEEPACPKKSSLKNTPMGLASPRTKNDRTSLLKNEPRNSSPARATRSSSSFTEVTTNLASKSGTPVRTSSRLASRKESHTDSSCENGSSSETSSKGSNIGRSFLKKVSSDVPSTSSDTPAGQLNVSAKVNSELHTASVTDIKSPTKSSTFKPSHDKKVASSSSGNESPARPFSPVGSKTPVRVSRRSLSSDRSPLASPSSSKTHTRSSSISKSPGRLPTEKGATKQSPRKSSSPSRAADTNSKGSSKDAEPVMTTRSLRHRQVTYSVS
ncbi:hypothetical protein C7M84_018167 [Penaeus vannamei]|uniref:Uncharacterized protein n=1 Tax=Penaeus vannamei TaxID=6689 RepID=A0A3R7MK96_PENVA|nr:hypothetical protein C7M84_018167 [Penaeus vannamei]